MAFIKAFSGLFAASLIHAVSCLVLSSKNSQHQPPETQHHLRKDSQAQSVSLSTEGMDGVGEVLDRGSGDKEEEKLLK